MIRAIYRPRPEFASGISAPKAASFGEAEPARGYAEHGAERGAYLFVPEDEAQHPNEEHFAGYYVDESEVELLDLLAGETGFGVSVYRAVADGGVVVHPGPDDDDGFESHEAAVLFVRQNYPGEFRDQHYSVFARRGPGA